MPKLIVRRLTTNWKLLLAIFAGVTMASSLVAGAPVCLWSLNRLSLNTAIDRASDKFLNLRTFALFVPLMESALAGGASAAFFEPREGIYLAVFYTIKNETNSAVIPGTHVNNVFSLIDSQGRVWPTATYYSHGFEVAYALGVPDGKEDPRAWVDTGTSYDTALAFDVAEDATGLRLRSELLNLEIGLGE